MADDATAVINAERILTLVLAEPRSSVLERTYERCSSINKDYRTKNRWAAASNLVKLYKRSRIYNSAVGSKKGKKLLQCAADLHCRRNQSESSAFFVKRTPRIRIVPFFCERRRVSHESACPTELAAAAVNAAALSIQKAGV
ncbi:unnamed protein product [Caenorhabditis auriculariae]|uniref:Uncharacterized protein n=1 Tax=Caenorhabditis auriculariae TaxID=2777116 RepID=A0A8S1HAV5_9PELO|nr:unnamed protein product [Caenorhabditis auriculariae]